MKTKRKRAPKRDDANDVCRSCGARKFDACKRRGECGDCGADEWGPFEIDFNGAGPRGLALGEWTDTHRSICSVQDSSSAEGDSIWLGVSPERMHLTIPMAVALREVLDRFIETGSVAL